jgi:hypothetical protein
MIFYFTASYAYVRHVRLIRKFRKRLGYWPHVATPRNWSEKVLWRKIFDHDPRFVALSDKLEVKKYFRAICPELKVIEPIWVGERPEDIPDFALAGDCVIKSNCGSSQNIFIHGGKYDRTAINQTINGWLSRRYGRGKGEWAYRQVKPKVLVEPMLKPKKNPEPVNLLFDCFWGEPKLAFMLSDKQAGRRKSGIFDISGRRMPFVDARFQAQDQRWPDDVHVPSCFHLAADLSRRLARGIDYCRIDFMVVDEQFYGLEISIYPSSGLRRFSFPGIPEYLGSFWDLRHSWFLNATQHGWRDAYAKALRERLSAEAGSAPTGQ